MKDYSVTEIAEILGGLNYYIGKASMMIGDVVAEGERNIKYPESLANNKRLSLETRTEARQDRNKIRREIAPDVNALDCMEKVLTRFEEIFTTGKVGDQKEYMEKMFIKMSNHVGELIGLGLKLGIESQMKPAFLIKTDNFTPGLSVLKDGKNYDVKF